MKCHKPNASFQGLQSISLFLVIIGGIFLTAGIAGAQTNMIGVSIVDTVPMDGVGDDIYAPMLVIGEVDGTWGPVHGLYRGELLIQLPTLPPACILAGAQLSLYLEHNPGTLGSLNVYYNPTRNTVSLNSTDYSDSAYTLVGTLVTSNSPAGQYCMIDVGPQIESAYENGSAVAAFRLQVDDLNFTGAPDHFYRFYFASAYPVFPAYLNEGITTPLSLPPGFGLSQATPSAAFLHWPTNATNYTLQCADSLSSPAWTTVTNEVAVIGQQSAFTVYLNKTAQFFRLRQK